MMDVSKTILYAVAVSAASNQDLMLTESIGWGMHVSQNENIMPGLSLNLKDD